MKITTHQISIYLPFTHPDSIDNLSPVYLLKASRLEFSTSIDQSSDLSNPVKLCRFDNEDALMALNEARDKDTINKAEKKGRCHNINKSSNSTLIDIVPSTSYYYYALSALSSQGVSVDILYQYISFSHDFGVFSNRVLAGLAFTAHASIIS